MDVNKIDKRLAFRLVVKLREGPLQQSTLQLNYGEEMK